MDIQLPQLTDTQVEGTVARWLKRPGDRVTRGDELAEIETDKVNSVIDAPHDGVLAEIVVAEGETVPVGAVIARIQVGGETEGIETGIPVSAGSQVSSPSTRGLSPARRRIAERVQEARATIPQGACVRQVDLSRVDRQGRSWTAYFVKAVAQAAGVSQVGVAVDAPDRLIVPVVRDADGSDLDALSSAITDLAGRGREGRLRPDEVSGAQFTVTNVGSVGTLMAFPLVTPGQSGVLGVGAIQGGRCYITLGFDRRAMNDYQADQLLARIAAGLEAFNRDAGQEG